MATSPFTHETRSEVVSTHLDGCEKLRMPISLRLLIQTAKPAHISTADFLLKGALDSYLLSLISAGYYESVQGTLDSLFGPHGNGRVPRGTGVVLGNGRALLDVESA
jgi:hypothetical protein